MTDQPGTTPNRRLERSSSDKLLFGVAGGLAKHLDIDPVLVRVGFVALLFMGGIGFIAYVAFAILMPQEQAPQGDQADTVKQNVGQLAEQASEAVAQAKSQLGKNGLNQTRAAFFGGALILVGAIILAANLGWFGDWFWSKWWPLVLIVLGVYLVSNRAKSKP